MDKMNTCLRKSRLMTSTTTYFSESFLLIYFCTVLLSSVLKYAQGCHFQVTCAGRHSEYPHSAPHANVHTYSTYVHDLTVFIRDEIIA